MSFDIFFVLLKLYLIRWWLLRIYVDYIFIINFIFDFIILFGIDIILKRNAKVIRIILGSFVGAISIIILFISISNIIFTLLKLGFGFLMVIIAFSYKDIKYTLNNFIYLMILSVLVGGFLYMFNIEAGYEHVGMVFIKNSDGLNMIILILLAILIVIIYVKKMRKLKKHLNSYYNVVIYVNNKNYQLKGFLDTGNNLKDPIFNKPICILNKDVKIDFSKSKSIFVPYKVLNNDGLLECFSIDKMYIEKIGYKNNYLVGLSSDKFSLEGVDIILCSSIMEE